MFYEKLIAIFQDHKLQHLFDEMNISQLSEYMQTKMDSNSKIVNPYEFSSSYQITLDRSLTMLMCFSNGNDSIFDRQYFFDCFIPGCAADRIFIDELLLDASQEPGEPLVCDECGSEYLLEDISSFIKVYFKIKPPSEISEIRNQSSRVDPNSTFQALRGLSRNLKSQSPLSSHNDKGDGAVEVRQLVSITDNGLGTVFGDKFRRIAHFIKG